MNRQPQGIPAAHPETSISLAADAFIRLAPGESEDFTEYADGDVITRLSVLCSDDGGTFHEEASKFLNF